MTYEQLKKLIEAHLAKNGTDPGHLAASLAAELETSGIVAPFEEDLVNGTGFLDAMRKFNLAMNSKQERSNETK